MTTSPSPYPGADPSQHFGPQHMPPAESPRKPWYKRWWGILIIVILVLILAFAAWVGIAFSRFVQVEHEAQDQCSAEVISKAKYPGGVQFVDEPTYNPDTVEINARGREVWAMGGEVDFPNAFGTPVRAKYMCLSEVSFEYSFIPAGTIHKTDAVVIPTNTKTP